jgi:hypothetical protein
MEANPIRKVVTLLQDMQKEIQTEGEVEQKMYDKFMCYCDGNTGEMQKSVEEAAQRITELKAKLESSIAEKDQLDGELIQHKQDREAATQDLAKATKIREKEHAEYLELTGESKENLDAMISAIAALEKGMGSGFLQSKTQLLDRLHKILNTAQTLDNYQRSVVTSFLSGGQNPYGDYHSQSGEIVGILKTMKDEMDKSLNGAVSDEETAAKGYEELAAAKKEEISAAGAAIESKTQRSGTLAVTITTTKGDIKDTTNEMDDTEAFLANLKVECAEKKKEFAVRIQIRAEEVAAISEAIKVLNDDDALDLFKKTLSLSQGPAGSQLGFIQAHEAQHNRAQQALYQLQASKVDQKNLQVQFLENALKAKSVDFTKVIKMVTDMEAVLKEEQASDDAQYSFCDKDIAKSEKEQKDTEEEIASSAALIEECKEASAATADEIAVLQKEIKELDLAVAEATEQRKEEHGEYIQFMEENNAAVQLLEKAKNKLFKFYRPSQYTAETTAAPVVLSQQPTAQPDILEGLAFVQVHQKEAPPPPPETWGAYKKKSGKSNGAIALLERLTKDLQDGIADAEHDEKTSQKDYETLMSDSQTSRAQKAQSITEKEAAKADLDLKVENASEQKTALEQELMNIKDYLSKLHAQCDFLVENYDVRKAARETELESLANAKAVLSGANFS